MASEAQKELFAKLLDQREFPTGTDSEALRSQFSTLDGSNASKWIERALAMPEKGVVPPPF